MVDPVTREGRASAMPARLRFGVWMKFCTSSSLPTFPLNDSRLR
ncbi:hypothetical protein [Luteimonas fraxinea]|nr:hypothetical protein [Luteimonas fraxinea]